ncbi:MAG TPA: hypothetical protein EYQ14_15980 [Gammaproteobacteria bacterium]|nr:hypothetical protein [Gammaproteobacteria bacterium]
MKQVQLDEALDDASTGVLQLDLSTVTASQNNRALKSIFKRSDYLGLSFLDLLAEVLDQATFQRAQQYLVLLNAVENNARLLQDINPLKNTSAKINKAPGQFVQRQFQFQFRREICKKRVSRVLVFVKPVRNSDLVAKSRNNQKQKNLKVLNNKKEQKHQKKQKKSTKSNVPVAVTRILEMDESIVEDFLEESIPALDVLLTLLRQSTGAQSKLQGRLDYICRAIHKIKGDAAILNFDEVVALLHKFEDRLEPLQGKEQLKKSDFVGFIAMIKSIITSLKKYNVILKRAGAGKGKSKRGNASVRQLFSRLQLYVEKISKEKKKSIRLVDEGFEQADIPIRLQKDVLSMVVQLLRNAVVHGIESRTGRKSAIKTSCGSIYLGLEKEVGSFTIFVRDDGAGLDLKKIKQVAIKSGKYTREQIDKCTADQLFNFILQSGFSTANKVDEHAGRGIGLDLVNTTVKGLGGKLTILTRYGMFTEFSMTFPC